MSAKNVIPKIAGFAILLLALDYAINDFVHPWFAVAWGIVVATCLFRTEIISWWHESRVRLSPQVQFALALALVLVALITTHRTALDWRRDVRQWGLLVFTALPLYRRGLAWAWSHLTRTGMSHS